MVAGEGAADVGTDGDDMTGAAQHQALHQGVVLPGQPGLGRADAAATGLLVDDAMRGEQRGPGAIQGRGCIETGAVGVQDVRAEGVGYIHQLPPDAPVMAGAGQTRHGQAVDDQARLFIAASGTARLHRGHRHLQAGLLRQPAGQGVHHRHHPARDALSGQWIWPEQQDAHQSRCAAPARARPSISSRKASTSARSKLARTPTAMSCGRWRARGERGLRAGSITLR